MRDFFSLAATTLAFALAASFAHIPHTAASTGTTSTTKPPALSLTADRYSVVAGRTAVLTWNSVSAARCTASGAWSGRKDQDGAFRTPPLQTSSTFTLTCNSSRGSLTRSVVINVTKPTTPTNTTTPTKNLTPKLQIQASTPAVKPGQSVTLSWSGQAVSNCQASGSWSGSRTASGSELRASLTASQNFTLSCDSAIGKVLAMTSVQVWSGGTQVSWAPPQQNDDGTPVTDLAAYRIYVGTVSQTYHQQFEVKNAAATQQFLDLLPGEYYIAMTAVDAQGNESTKSNEVRKIVR